MRKKLALIIALVMVFGVVAACATDSGGGDAPVPEPTPATPTPAEVPELPEDVPDDPTQISAELTMWTGTWNDGKMEELLAIFNETYPNIHVNFEYGPWDGMEDRYFAAMRAGVIPDVIDIAIAWTIPFAKMGHLLPVDEFAARHGVDLQGTYFEGGLMSAYVDGLHYALPYRTEVGSIFMNLDLFEQAGLDPNSPPTTWDEMIEYGRAIQALGGGIHGFGLAGHGVGNTTFQVYSLWFSNGVDILNEDHTAAAFNTPAGVEVLEFWVNELATIAPPNALENDNTANRNLFAQGLLGMYLSGPFDLDPIREANPDLNKGFALFPAFSPDHPPRVQQGGWNIAMTTNVTGERADAAFLWISFLASAEISVIFSDTLSAVRAAADDPAYDDPDLEIFLEALALGRPVPGNIAMNAITAALYSEFQAVLAGIKTPQEALDDAEARVNELLETFQ